MVYSRRENVTPLVQFGRAALHAFLVICGGSVLTLAFFMVLPLLQAISKARKPDTVLQSVDMAAIDPPPPPPEPEEPEKEPEPEEPPKLAEASQPLDLSQLELALNPGGGGGWATGDFGIQLDKLVGAAASEEAGISFDDFDQAPRLKKPVAPKMDADVRRKAPGEVFVLLEIDAQGRVSNAIVERSSDPVFEQPALQAVKRWAFEPGKRNGEPVPSRARQKIKFPKT